MEDSERQDQRTIGEFSAKIDQLLSGQKLERAGRQRIYRKLEEISSKQTEHEGRLNLLDDRFEVTQAAIDELEKFKRQHDVEIAAEQASITANRRWLKGLGAGFAGLGAIETDHVTGGRLLRFLAGLFGQK